MQLKKKEVCLSGLKTAIQNIEKKVVDTSEIQNPPLDLICGVCLGVMYRPSTLPCAHTFCTNCLKTILKKEDYIICPFCRRHCPEIRRVDVNKKLADEILGELRQKQPTEKSTYSAKEFVLETHIQYFKESVFGVEEKHFWEIKVKLANKRKHRSHQMIEQIKFKFGEEQDLVKQWGAAHQIQIKKYGEPGLLCTIVVTFAPSLKRAPIQQELVLSQTKGLHTIQSSVVLECRHTELKPEKVDSSKSVTK